MADRFPDGFWWGTATAAHQVEGNNWNNDWWAWEHQPGTPCVEPSLDACDHYHRYPDDIALLAALGFDNYRFSIEWSRIEPEEGFFSKAALDHYRRVCATCLEHGIDPVVTFHHFTSPRWVAADGGWTNPATIDRFCRFAEQASKHLGDLITRACTINEPNIVAFLTYMVGAFPPGTRDKNLYKQSQEVFRDAHCRVRDVIKAALGDKPVGLTLAMSDYQAVPPDDEQAVAMRDRYRRVSEDFYLDAVRGDDFIGVQTYSRTRVGAGGPLGPEPGVPVLPMGYEYYPESLGATIRRAWEVTGGVPVLVTENGIGTDDDDQRISYLRTALRGVLDCLADGITVLGYTCWSLLDNFEWAFGYGPKFGLVAVERSTQLRTAKPSAYWLGSVARANALVD
ncbi:MAG: glycoside hydrolase family 1 protein [Acidimicrobiales bacterium]|nr:glycoside hydrolase family 1 protein [Acidimicrobiales bacterium]